jgi:hypothetical protein
MIEKEPLNGHLPSGCVKKPKRWNRAPVESLCFEKNDRWGAVRPVIVSIFPIDTPKTRVIKSQGVEFGKVAGIFQTDLVETRRSKNCRERVKKKGELNHFQKVLNLPMTRPTMTLKPTNKEVWKMQGDGSSDE